MIELPTHLAHHGHEAETDDGEPEHQVQGVVGELSEAGRAHKLDESDGAGDREHGERGDAPAIMVVHQVLGNFGIFGQHIP
jgi:hypothetical protein